MSDVDPADDRGADGIPAGVEPAEAGGIRSRPFMRPAWRSSNEKVALVLSEHLRDDDELHASHAVVQSGWTNHAPQPANVIPRAAASPSCSSSTRACSSCAPANPLRPRPSVFELSDDPEVSIDVLAKVPGPVLELGPAALRLDVDAAFAGDGALEAYERLLYDVMVGDPTLFTRAEQIKRLWEICQPVLDDPPAPLPCARGSWGPEEALALPGPRGWRLPDA